MTVTPGRLALAERAQALRAEGAPYAQVATALGISRSYASGLVNDPTGEKERKRKLRYCGVCEDCGAPTSGHAGRALAPRCCARCTWRRQHEQRRWTREVVVEAIRRFAVEHDRQPTWTEWVRSDARADGYPSVGVVLREWGSWAAAVEAAGFEASAKEW